MQLRTLKNDKELYLNCRVRPTYEVEGHDFQMETCIKDRSGVDDFVKAWYIKAKNSDIFFCPNIADSFACMASYCLGSSRAYNAQAGKYREQPAVDCFGNPISTYVIIQALGGAEKYYKEAGLAGEYPEMLEAWKKEEGYGEGDDDF